MPKKKQPAKPDEEMVTLAILYETSESGGGSDGEGGREDTYITTSFKGAYIGEPQSKSYRMSCKTFEVPKKEFEAVLRTHLYVVVCYYSDGDTFSHSHGHMQMEGVYGNLQKAQAVAAQWEKAETAPWKHYFASLDRVSVEVLPIIGTATPVGDPNDIPSW